MVVEAKSEEYGIVYGKIYAKGSADGTVIFHLSAYICEQEQYVTGMRMQKYLCQTLMLP